ncbi:MAG: ACT domain-containing protein [Hungatella sp.]|nr:ACT domain-containing protein [Hungatella sp.]
MKIEIIDGEFSVCKVWDFSQVNFEAEYCFTGKTDEEKSLVCLTEDVPENTAVRDDGWRAFRVQGVLDFSLIGILSRISAVLAESGVGIFAISTYNTDYILTKRDNWEMALQAIKKAGWGMRAQ